MGSAHLLAYKTPACHGATTRNTLNRPLVPGGHRDVNRAERERVKRAVFPGSDRW